MAMLKDEVSVVKAVMMEVTDNVIFLVNEHYHTEVNPETGKIDRSKSFYRWVGRADTKENYRKLIAWYMDDSRRLERGKWPDEPTPYFFCVGKGSENWRIGNYFETKMKKLRSWEDGQKRLHGWETKTVNRDCGYNPGALYVIEGYKDPDGNVVDILSKEEVLKHVGQNLIAPHIMKSKLPVNKAKSSIA